MLEADPRLLYSWNALPFVNCQRKLYCPVNNHVGDVDGLVLCVHGSGDVCELEELFNGRKESHNWFTKMVSRLPNNVLALEEFVRN